MNSTKANLINSVCLIAIGLWGYLEVTSPTALIPVGFGAALIRASSSGGYGLIAELKKAGVPAKYLAELESAKTDF